MKKMIIWVLTLTLLGSLAACGRQTYLPPVPPAAYSEAQDEIQEDPSLEDLGKISHEAIYDANGLQVTVQDFRRISGVDNGRNIFLDFQVVNSSSEPVTLYMGRSEKISFSVNDFMIHCDTEYIDLEAGEEKTLTLGFWDRDVLLRGISEIVDMAIPLWVEAEDGSILDRQLVHIRPESSGSADVNCYGTYLQASKPDLKVYENVYNGDRVDVKNAWIYYGPDDKLGQEGWNLSLELENHTDKPQKCMLSSFSLDGIVMDAHGYEMWVINPGCRDIFSLRMSRNFGGVLGQKCSTSAKTLSFTLGCEEPPVNGGASTYTVEPVTFALGGEAPFTVEAETLCSGGQVDAAYIGADPSPYDSEHLMVYLKCTNHTDTIVMPSRISVEIQGKELELGWMEDFLQPGGTAIIPLHLYMDGSAVTGPESLEHFAGVLRFATADNYHPRNHNSGWLDPIPMSH